jgi:twitching motility protein PilT
VLEILKSSMRTREYVLRGENEGRSLTDAMHDGQVDGMRTFDDELEKLVYARSIAKETALLYATNPTNLALRLIDEADSDPSGDSSDDSMMSLLE